MTGTIEMELKGVSKLGVLSICVISYISNQEFVALVT